MVIPYTLIGCVVVADADDDDAEEYKSDVTSVIILVIHVAQACALSSVPPCQLLLCFAFKY